MTPADRLEESVRPLGAQPVPGLPDGAGRRVLPRWD